ncbi:MAG: glycosyl transferase [Thermodesulfobacteriota bacterium]
MADFQQSPPIATLHRLGQPDRPALEADLLAWSAARPPALVLPALMADIQAPSFARLAEELAGAGYLAEIIVVLGAGGRRGAAAAAKALAGLPQPCLVLDEQGRALTRLLAEMAQDGLALGQPGKGRAVWLGLGLALAAGRARVAAVQDADILDYDRALLARLLHPVMHPGLGHRLAKGYYARYSHELHGRVARLCLAPLLAALETLLGRTPYLAYLQAFRYPLAGETALDLDLAAGMDLCGGWGLELGLLGEAWRRLHPGQICQVDLAERFDHRHQELEPDQPDSGLGRMCAQIALALCRDLAAEGAAVSRGLTAALEAGYHRQAARFMDFYAADAAINRLEYDWRREALAVEVFGRGLARGLEAFLAQPRAAERLPAWRGILTARPEWGARLLEAARADNP